jgi:alpha-L-arabinofuranosidase
MRNAAYRSPITDLDDMKCCISLLCGVAAFATAATTNLPITTITIGDSVTVARVMPFGINIGGDAYYSTPMAKCRVQENFEGTLYRQCHKGILQTNGFISMYANKKAWDATGWTKTLTGADFTIISGPAYGTRGKVRAISEQPASFYNRPAKLCAFIEFAAPIALPNGAPIMDAGILVENLATNEGWCGEQDGHWQANSALLLHDVHPGAFGVAALQLDGTRPTTDDKSRGAAGAFVRFPTHMQRYGDLNGTWQVRLWAKATHGTPTLTVQPTLVGGRAKFNAMTQPLSNAWRMVEWRIPIAGITDTPGTKASPQLQFLVQIAGGIALIDDVLIEREGDKNPTVFRDDIVTALRQLNLGIVRKLQMGGETVENFIRPPLESYRSQNSFFAKTGPAVRRGAKPWGLHDEFALCEHLGTEAWFGLPGTMQEAEADVFMEYVGAPATVGYGKLRAQLGHPEPWTTTLKTIHVEIGNEAWNTMFGFMAGGFNGPDYWERIFARIKKSPYYSSNIVCHAAGQNYSAAMSKAILGWTPSADRYAIAPYQIHKMSKQEAATLRTDRDLFRWMLSAPLLNNFGPQMLRQGEISRATGVEFSVYEINHHITGGDGPLEPRNKLVTSAPAAISIINCMLTMLKEHGMRSQCFFTFGQLFYRANQVGDVRLWGALLASRAGQTRWRPTGLALQLVNRALHGDLLATTHSGATPTFATLDLEQPRNPRQSAQTPRQFPVLWSYAFKNDAQRSAILVNLDIATAHNIALQLPGGVNGAVRIATLAGKALADNNEFEHAQPQVAIAETTVTNFAGGATLSLAPCSLTVVQWRE